MAMDGRSTSPTTPALPEQQSHSQDVYTTTLLCLFSMMLAGILLCFLHILGFVTSADASRCPQDFLGRYAGCQARQDIKALLSFVLGALVIVTGAPAPEQFPANNLRNTLLTMESCAGLL
mmetsp:Transcript_14145/g.26493  ORF Transcript_14145/g.26493 Transcript_14145/m.26493 type:complete len:120 (+) Transcript_14145:113-472(+)